MSNITWIVRATCSAFWTMVRRTPELEKEWCKDGEYSEYYYACYCGQHNFMCMDCEQLKIALIELYFDDNVCNWKIAKELISSRIDHKCNIVPYVKIPRDPLIYCVDFREAGIWAKSQLRDAYETKIASTIMCPILFIVHCGIKKNKKQNTTHDVFSHHDLIMYINLYIEKDFNKFVKHVITSRIC